MVCKVCNTRIAMGRNTCPNCGSNSILESAKPKSRRSTALPQIDYAATSESEATELDDAVELDIPAEVEGMTDESVDLELDEPAEVAEVTELDDAVELDVPPEVDERTDESVEVELDEPAGASASEVSQSEKKNPAPEILDLTEMSELTGVVSPDPAAVRAALGDQPALLEPGLSVYTSEKGTPQGVGYTSAVGEIDLLAWDAQGGIVVVMVAGAEDGPELISGVLQRMGWVSKHLCGSDQSVRGIVLLEDMPEQLSYAAAAVADTIAFKTWRVALSFSDLEV